MLLSLISWHKKLFAFAFFVIFIVIFLFTNLSKAEKMLFAEGQQEVKNQDQTQSFKEPEWNGVYVIDNSGNYRELIPISKGKIERFKSKLTGGEYLFVTINPQEVNHVSWNNFKGFLFKGQQVIEKIQINKAMHTPLGLGKVAAFLEGWAGGDRYSISIEDFQDNLYESQMRCKTRLDTSYCEFKNRELMKKNLGDKCLFIIIGELPKENKKTYMVCFEK
jgi:hypothetical protein